MAKVSTVDNVKPRFMSKGWWKLLITAVNPFTYSLREHMISQIASAVTLLQVFLGAKIISMIPAGVVAVAKAIWAKIVYFFSAVGVVLFNTTP